MDKLLKRLETTIEENEQDILLYVARKLNLPFDKEVNDYDKLHQQILQFEREGKTGLDCGWSYVLGSNPQDQSILERVADATVEQNTKRVTGADYWLPFMKTPTTALQFKLLRYPLNVQSTTIKDAVNSYVLERVGIELGWYTTSKLD